MRVYKPSDEPKNKQIGECECEVCGAIGKLILRQGKQFRFWFCECPNGHRPQIKVEIDDIFQIGDRVRLYHSTFGKDAEIIFDTYTEGIVIAKERSIINYLLSVKIDKAIFNNKSIPKRSWIYGYIVRGVQSDDNTVELLTPQMRMII
jgi:hypothetical protein